jgi:outer membrane protein TolC
MSAMRPMIPEKVRGKFVTVKRALVFILLLAQAGCVTYQQTPLTEAAVNATLAAPAMPVLTVEAERIRHPILKPVPINAAAGLSPDEAAILAVLVNPELKVQRDRKGVSAAQLFQAGILPNPQFGASLDFPVAGDTHQTVTAYGLTLDYDIVALITRGAKVDAARLHTSSVALDVAWQEWQVAQAAKLHTYRLSLLERKMRIVRQEEVGLQANFDAVQRSVADGTMTVIDLSAARASLERVHLSTLGILQNLEQERFALQKAIGFEPGHPIRLRRQITLPRTASLPATDELLAGIADRRLDLVALRIGYQSQEQTLRAAVLGQFPRITTGVGQARGTDTVVTRGFSLTIGLPFFDFNQGQIAIAQATRKQLFDAYAARLFDARSSVASLRADIEAIAGQIRATEAYLPVQQKLVSTYYDALRQGNADVLTYYQARDEFIASRIALIDLQMNLVDRFVALEIASGEYLSEAQKQEKGR